MTRTSVGLLGAMALLTSAASASPGPAAQRLERNPALDVRVEEAVTPLLRQFAGSWNRNDVKGLASAFSEDAVLINPMGRVARGRAQIEKLFRDEHQGPMRGTSFTHRVTDAREVAPGLIFVDEEMTITGGKDAAGKPVPDQAMHGAMLLAKREGRWQIVEARPYGFSTPGPAAAAVTPTTTSAPETDKSPVTNP